MSAESSTPNRGVIRTASNYGSRKNIDRFMRGLTVAATVLALVPLFLILGYVLVRGASGLTPAFFAEAYKPPKMSLDGAVESSGGVLHGIIGTLLITGTAMLIAAPVGILAGVFLAEYRSNAFANIVRFCTDVLSAAPSIVVGVVAYILIVQRRGAFSGWAGAVALAVLMVPLICRTTEEILRLVPATTREAAMALGAPKWWLTLTVVIPTALSGIVTGLMLAFARAAGETAPLLLTILGNNNVSYDLLKPMAALPLLTYKYTDTPFPALNQLAWTTALVLTVLVLTVNLLVRWATRSRLK